jgi:hypothetical protein
MAVGISFEEVKVCTTRLRLCLFCKYREEKIDLEASRFGLPFGGSGLKLILMMSLMV